MLKIGEGKSVNISNWLKMNTNVLYISSKAPVSCRMEQKLKEVLPHLSGQYRRLPVLDKARHVRGVISATDVLRVLSGLGKKRYRVKNLTDVKVKGVMHPHVLHIDKNMHVKDVIEFFKQHRKGAYPVTYRKELVGMVSEWDVIRQIRGRTKLKVSDVMVRRPMTAQEHHSVADIAGMLSMGGFRRLPVVKNDILVGLVTPRDVLSFLQENRLFNKLREQKQPVSRIMKKNPYTVQAGAELYEAVRIMVSRKIGGLPVLEEHELVGIITERDIVDVVDF
ncbi:MAG: CBS domain-containing protein [Candidatus Aenigmatarchaeota archaeon]|nr:MAG: CBS domain-containing protein [Candidatus Aenigmarchaeota archaeon]